MSTTRISALLILLLALMPATGTGSDWTDGFRTLHEESSSRSFEPKPGQTTLLVVDNVFGSIRVEAHDASRIELRLTKTVRARSQANLERALAEVSLDVHEEPGLVDLYVNGPFRDKTDRGRWSQWRDPGYQVVYDFGLRVPRDVEIRVKTVDGGDLVVDGIGAAFDVRNVNGGIEMYDVSGSGSAKTVNGPVRVEFTRNPTSDSRFETVNGDVEVAFRDGLSAELEMATTFGSLWSHWKVQPLQARPPIETTRGDTRVIRTDRGARVRIGTGGPTHSFETLNGDVLIRRSRRDAASDNS